MDFNQNLSQIALLGILYKLLLKINFTRFNHKC